MTSFKLWTQTRGPDKCSGIGEKLPNLEIPIHHGYLCLKPNQPDQILFFETRSIHG